MENIDVKLINVALDYNESGSKYQINTMSLSRMRPIGPFNPGPLERCSHSPSSCYSADSHCTDYFTDHSFDTDGNGGGGGGLLSVPTY